MEEQIVLPAYLTVGSVLREQYAKKHPANRRIHIRVVVDSEWVVYCWYSRRKGWRYNVEHYQYFESLKERGILKTIKTFSTKK